MQFNHYGESLNSTSDFLFLQKDYEESLNQSDFDDVETLQKELSQITENLPDAEDKVNSESEVFWKLSTEDYQNNKESSIFDILKSKLPI